jgi:hypothetical protein
MSKLNQIKIPVDVLKEQGIETEFNYKLARERDGLIKQSKDIKWIEWDENGKFKDDWWGPEVGFSLLMSPFNHHFTWMTTEIVELIKNTPTYVKFKTKNSVYELFKIN